MNLAKILTCAAILAGFTLSVTGCDGPNTNTGGAGSSGGTSPGGTGGGGTAAGGTAGGGTAGGGTAGGGTGGTGGSACTPEDDSNECTDDVCNDDGTTAHNPKAAGEACMNGGSQCDGNGACVECLGVDDCPGDDNACQMKTCMAGQCGFDFIKEGTPVPMQTAGDCQVAVCDGAGATVDQDDDADPPDDSNPCTSDVCNGGVPSNPSLPLGTACGSSGSGDPLVCNDMAQCVGCNVPADCAGSDDECKARTCTAGVCGVAFTQAGKPVAAQTPNNCLVQACDGAGNIADIADDSDTPVDDGNACTDETCAMGMPMHPNKTNGAACSDANGCTLSDTCQDGACTGSMPVMCAAQDQCHAAGMCDPATGLCSNPSLPNGTACNDGSACTLTDTCQSGTCSGNAVVCMAQDQCHVAGTCDPATGMCSNPSAADGAACMNGAFAGACSNGACVACGDGVMAGAEQCDDGNAASGDCCSATCQLEAGCEMEPNDSCAAINPLPAFTGSPLSAQVKGNINPVLDYDFYSFVLPGPGAQGIRVETFFGSPGTCGSIASNDTAIQLRGTDCATVLTSNDDDFTPGWCSTISGATVAAARGMAPGTYTVRVARSTLGTQVTLAGYSLRVTILSTCANGTPETSETCDDGNATAGDGCSAVCQTESGFLCTGTPSVCTPACGNGALNAGETCDDGNANAGDGCSATCQTEAGYLCSGTPSVCALACGNGALNAGETCDDGNANAGDGCSSACAIEPGYICSGTPSVCAPIVCGDGTVSAGEQCDDGNVAAGDGCSSTCQWETISEIEPNETTAQADAAPILITAKTQIAGAITPTGDLDTFKVNIASAGPVRFEVFDPGGSDCIGMTTMTLKLLDSAGVQLKQDTPAGEFTIDSGIGVCPALSVSLEPGTYYIQAAKSTAGTIAGYFMRVTFPNVGATEVEPNDAQGTANAFTGSESFVLGAHPVSGNDDWYAVTVPAGKSLRAEIVEGDLIETCESNDIDAFLTLRNSAGTSLVTDDDSGRGYCSQIDGTGATPLDSGAHNLTGGVYYLQVSQSSFATGTQGIFNYRLIVTIR